MDAAPLARSGHRLTDHQAIIHLQQLKLAKLLRRCTPRWLDFVGQFSGLTSTYLQGEQSQVADTIAPFFFVDPRPPNSLAVESLTLLLPATELQSQRDPALNTRRAPADYRVLAGLLSRVPRKRAPPSPLPPASPPPIPVAADLLPASQHSTGTPNGEGWSCSYQRCSTSCDASTTAIAQSCEGLRVDFRNSLFSFPYEAACLRVSINGLWCIGVLQFPAKVTYFFSLYQDPLTARRRAQKKSFLTLSKYYYCPGMRASNTAYVVSWTQCCTS